MRKATVSRKTKETTITIKVNLDGAGTTSVATGIPFLDHMLDLLGKHGLIDLDVKAKGDLHIDVHHTNEDIGLALGQAFDQALGDRAKITRVGSSYVPMDETLARAVVDISGRGRLVLRLDNLDLKRLTRSAAYQWGDAQHFLESFARTAKMTVHVEVLYGTDFHHTCEAAFKALGRALEQAVRVNPRVKGIPSTKGKL